MKCHSPQRTTDAASVERPLLFPMKATGGNNIERGRGRVWGRGESVGEGERCRGWEKVYG